MTPTCETAGVLGPAVAVIASFEAVEAIKLLSGAFDALNKELIMVDVWDWTFRRLKVAGLLGKVDCPCCQHRQFEWLDGALGSHTTTLCGRNAVQVATRRAEPLNFAELALRLAAPGRGPAQRLHAPVRHRGARVHRLPRRPRHHQGDQRHRQGRGRSTPSSWGAD